MRYCEILAKYNDTAKYEILRDTGKIMLARCCEIRRDTARYCEILRNTQLLNAGELAGEMLMNTGGAKP